MPLAYGSDLRSIPFKVHADTVYSSLEPPCIVAPLTFYVCGVAVGESCSKGLCLCLVLHWKERVALVRQVGRSCLKHVFTLVGNLVVVRPAVVFAFLDKANNNNGVEIWI